LLRRITSLDYRKAKAIFFRATKDIRLARGQIHTPTTGRLQQPADLHQNTGEASSTNSALEDEVAFPAPTEQTRQHGIDHSLAPEYIVASEIEFQFRFF
jgi:hypothetical protein